ncbi:MAG TPA: hypothetical protein VES01_02190 [Dermatophilaceae bacterium]|nr:hypothetical protein [Dermatophilaceae bacterium]
MRVGARTVDRIHDFQIFGDQFRQPDLFRHRDHRDQPGITDQNRVVEHDVDHFREIQ